jgi:exopolysaccharide biosynthesis polyprenyl glycosylphosphotransferase
MHRLVGPALALLDAICVALALFAAWSFWTWRSPNLGLLMQVPYLALWFPNRFITSGLVLAAAWTVVMRQLGMQDPGRMENSSKIAGAVTRSAVWMSVLVVVENSLLGERIYPKSLVVPFLGSIWAVALAARLLVFRLLLRLERPPTAVNALIVGVETDGLLMADRLVRDARHVCRVAGHLRPGSEENPQVAPEEILGGIDDFARLVNEHRIGMIVLATRSIPREEALRLAVQADHMGLRVLQAPYSWGVVSPRLGFARIGGLDLIDLVGIQYPTLAEQVKRGFDLVAVTVGGALLLPFLLAVAAAIKLGDGGPVLYVSPRVGRGGRTFGFYKFRSMVVDADRKREELAHLNESDGRLFKIKDDPRVTRAGRWIRKFSVDELPQLFNVLRGDMNLVGPRPLPERDLAGIEKDPEMAYWFEQRSKVQPGITGLWQVSGRSDLGFGEMVRFDIHYIQNWSLWLDLQILVKTLPAVVRGRGAM